MPADIAEVLAIADAFETAPPEGLSTTSDETGFAFELEYPNFLAASELVAAMDAALGFVCEFGQTIRFRRYRPGESHPLHPDHFTIDGKVLAATAMLCLTDVEQGGETEFPAACPPVAVRPRTGRLMLWANYLEDGSPDMRTEHLAHPVTVGTKATITRFAYLAPERCRSVVRRLATP
jgi:hypothetical protein